MKPSSTLFITAVSQILVGTALAAVGPEEAAQLGKSLTPVGAERAGNKDGTIPEWTGGLTSVPAQVQVVGDRRPDPFASEKPRLSITGKDVDTYADKLTEGTKALLRRYPTMRVDVYPTHRTVFVPQRVIENTQKNALATKLVDDGEGLSNALPGYPFPIPNNGLEVMWNHQLNYRGLGLEGDAIESWSVDASGTPVLTTVGKGTYVWSMYDLKKTTFSFETEPFWYLKLSYVAPTRRSGEALLGWDSAVPLKQPRRVWQYLPGQRRVKAAPEVAYDTPNPDSLGTATYDEDQQFGGALDRFDFKLLGKKEIIVPYSNYKLTYWAPAADITKPGHINPDVVRWELHRVWVVEAKLKEGKRHIYSKRLLYIDEDSWAAVASDQYDGRGQLFRAGFQFTSFAYDAKANFTLTQGNYDLNSGIYNIKFVMGDRAKGIKFLSEAPDKKFWSPEALAGAGIR